MEHTSGYRLCLQAAKIDSNFFKLIPTLHGRALVGDEAGVGQIFGVHQGRLAVGHAPEAGACLLTTVLCWPKCGR
jgi:hypothetical protein